MSDAAPAHSALIAARYDLAAPVALGPLGHTGVNNAVWLVRTGSGDFVWKLLHASVNLAALEYEHWLVGELASQSPPFAVPLPVRTRDGATYCQLPEGGLGVLLPRLPGDQIARHDPAEIAALGEATGTLMAALARVPQRPHPTFASFLDLRAIHARMSDPFALTPADLGLSATPQHEMLLDWWRGLLADMAIFMAGPYRALPRQLTHGDFGPMNVLAIGGRVTAVLDFEFAQPDARLIDVVSPLVHAMRLWEHETPDALAMAAAFCQGFRRTGALDNAEIAALPQTMLLRNIAVALWWFGRDLDEGRTDSLERLIWLRKLADWLAEQGDELREVVRGSYES